MIFCHYFQNITKVNWTANGGQMICGQNCLRRRVIKVEEVEKEKLEKVEKIKEKEINRRKKGKNKTNKCKS